MGLIWPLVLLIMCIDGIHFVGSASKSSGYEPARKLLDPELAQIPPDILACYADRRLWERYSRLPMSVDSLSAIVRKAELHPDIRDWNPGFLAATLVHKFRFDGIVYDRCIDTSEGALPFRIDLQVEFPKMALIYQLINGERKEFPEDALTMEEKCALHWMLSYSVNTTFRTDEIFWASDFGVSGPYANDVNYRHGSGVFGSAGAGAGTQAGQVGFYAPEVYDNRQQRPSYGSPAFLLDHTERPKWRDCELSQAKSRSPWEMGVVWSETGPLAAGPMIAGLAAGLQPQSVSWEAGSVDNGWGASLAGDLGQTALMKRKDEPWLGPDGFFNSTICPSEFYLRATQQPPTFSRLTVAEINGGIDGLLMSEYAEQWESKSEFTLSQIIDSYYSPEGIYIQGSTPFLSACDRYSNYLKIISPDKLSDQAFIFGVELKNVVVAPVGNNALKAAIATAKTQLDEEIKVLDQVLNDFGLCRAQRERDGYKIETYYGEDLSPIDAEFESAGIADVAVILDNSIYSYEDELYMKQVSGAVAGHLDVWATLIEDDRGREVMAQGGSLYELVEGRYGNVLISTLDNSEFYLTRGDDYGYNYHNKTTNETNYKLYSRDVVFNRAEMACNVIKEPFPPVSDIDPARSLEAAVNRMYQRLLDNQEREGDGEVTAGAGRAQVVVLIMFSRVTTDDRALLNDAVYRIRRYYPSTHLLVLTRWAPRDEFWDLVQFPEFDIFQLDQYNEEMRAERDGRRIAERIAQLTGALTYTCEDTEDPSRNENRARVTLYVRPDTQRFVEINPKYFSGADGDDALEITFRAEGNAVRVCRSRASPEEIALGKSRWEDSGYEDEEDFDPSEDCQSAGEGGKVVFRWDEDPCDGASITRCRPIYFRLIGVDSGGTRCVTEDGFPCRTADTSLVEVTHRGMLCDAARARMEIIVVVAVAVLRRFVSGGI